MSDDIDYNEEFIRVMRQQIGESKWSVFEVYSLGEALLNYINIVVTLGHTRPGNSLEYVHPDGRLGNDIVRDFVAWTSGRKNKAEGCEERLRAEIVDSGWSKVVGDRMSNRLLELVPELKELFGSSDGAA